MVKYSPIEIALLSTLSYTDQFEFPLTEKEMWQRLIAPPEKSKKSFPYSVYKTALHVLLKKKKIEQSDTYYFLPGRKKISKTREQRYIIAREKWARVSTFLQRVSWLPTVQAVFVTGSLAMDNVDKESDYDFMIVTLPHTLWLTRLLITCIAWLSGKRRSWQGEEKNNWCLNLWLDTEHLSIQPQRRNIYTAYEVIQAKPIFARQHVDHLFLAQNTWVKEYLPNVLMKRATSAHILPSILEQLLAPLDWIAWKFQLWYMQPHRTSEKVARGYAFFHPRDTKAIITKNWQASLQKVGL
jgi:hypothetical protein